MFQTLSFSSYYRWATPETTYKENQGNMVSTETHLLTVENDQE